jgi:N6-L-threonylcarbamoyladenine synthase
LIVSGGHTQIVIANEEGVYETIGRTIDDAAGEAYDKVARLLQLGYPGGPIIDKLAKAGNVRAITFKPAVIKNSEREFDFSFSGLKTAVINYYRKNPETKKEDICASFQKSVIDALTEKTIAAAKKHNLKRIYLAGGVSANSGLREAFKKAERLTPLLKVSFPPLKFCTDNAAMIGGAAIPKLFKKEFIGLSIKAEPNLIL